MTRKIPSTLPILFLLHLPCPITEAHTHLGPIIPTPWDPRNCPNLPSLIPMWLQLIAKPFVSTFQILPTFFYLFIYLFTCLLI